MRHYRKIDTRILFDQKFNQLSSEAKLVFLHLLIHPDLTSLGAMRASIPGIAHELRWEVEQLRSVIEVLRRQGMVSADEKASFIWFPNFLKHNPPESPNVVKSWSRVLAGLPECPLRDVLVREARRFVQRLSISFQAALGESFQ